MITTRKDYPYDAVIMRIKNKQWKLEKEEIEEKSKKYILDKLSKNQDIFHIIIENNIVLNGSNVLNCLIELQENYKNDYIGLIKFNNFTLNIIEILK